MLSFEDSFDSPDTNRSIACSARGETFSIVSCTASISICHVTDKDRPRGRPAVESPRQRKKRKRETRYFVGGKREREKKERKGRPPAWSAHSVAAINPISQAGVPISALPCPSRVHQLDFRSILWTRCLGTKAKNRDQSCLWSRESVSEPGPFSRRRKRRRARVLLRGKRVRKRSRRRQTGV